MSKRKKAEPNPEEEEDDDNDSRDKPRQQGPPQKIYDFHKKTIEVYPQRLHELNQQFLSSISSQIQTEPYSVLVGNCLDYVRQYFNYEDDLLQYSPWLATRLKQSRSDIVKHLQETIDVYDALARHDFDRIIDKNNIQSSLANDLTSNGNDNSVQSTIPSFQLRAPTTTTTTATSSFSFTKPTTTTASSDATPTASFSFTKPTAASSDSTPLSFAKPPTTSTVSSDSTPLTGFSFTKPTTTTTSNDSTPSTGFSFTKPTATTTSNDSTPSTGFSFKLPSSTASPEKTANTSPFAFSIPNTGFGTPTFTSPSFGSSTTTEKPAISFATPQKFSFTPTPIAGTEQQGTTEDNDDEASEPPEPEKVDHEADAKLTYRCRMGVNKGGKLIKRGPVQVILKELNEKRQLIVRSDDTLGRLYLNILWSKLIEPKKNSTKDLTFVCKLNPGMPEVNEGEFVMILFRFDNESDRNDAYEKLDKERT